MSRSIGANKAIRNSNNEGDSREKDIMIDVACPLDPNRTVNSKGNK